MFTVVRREQVRALLLDRARDDERIAGAAITGSSANKAADRWSDIDLFFGVADGHDVAHTLNDWSDFVYRELGALHHFNLQTGAATYRAFLLDDLLEIDLAFTPVAEFGPLGSGAFDVVFGTAAARQPRPSDADHLIGLAWHHVLHARIVIERGAPWQAEYWISAIRDEILALASLRLGLPAGYAKGSDQLPAEVTEPVRDALVRSLDGAELSRALHAATRALIGELRQTDDAVAERLTKPLLALAADNAEGPPPMAPTLAFTTVNLSAPDPHVLGRFYHQLIGGELKADEPDWVVLRPPGGGVGIAFQTEEDYTPPVWPAESGRQQMMMHLEIGVDDLDSAVARATTAGATLVDYQPQDDVRVCLDPAGHPFCLWLDQ